MDLDSILIYINMGGFSAYVWPAYGACAGIMTWLITASYIGLLREKRMLAKFGSRRTPVEKVSDIDPAEALDDS